MAQEDTTKTTTKQTTGFVLDLNGSSSDNLPATVATTTTPVVTGAGGLSYASATTEERAEMDRIIATIDLKNPDSVVNLGADYRKKLGELSDGILDSLQPSVQLAFAAAVRELLETVKLNSLEDIKKRIADGALKRAGKALFNAITRKDSKIEVAKETIERFMTDITKSRKTISEMVDKIEEQQIELNKNYERIKLLGAGMNTTAQDLRIVRAASAEYIRRVESGDITTLADLQNRAQETKRADDLENLQVANASWKTLRNVDAALLKSIAIYDLNVATLAFAKEGNIDSRMETANTLLATVPEWKAQLAMFGVIMTEKAAKMLIGAAGDLSARALEANKSLFDELVNITLQGPTGGFKISDIIALQSHMGDKLKTVGPAMEEIFSKQAEEKKALEQSIQDFRQVGIDVFGQKKGILSTAIPATPNKPPKL